MSQFDDYDSMSLNLYASGPLIKDKLFFFAMYEGRDYEPNNSDDAYETYFEGRSNSGFWGSKIDWQITDNHTLSLLAFSDNDKLTTDEFGIDPGGDFNGTRNYQNTTFNETGGDNWALTYTGYLTDNFSVRAMKMISKTSRTSTSGVTLMSAKSRSPDDCA